MELSGVVKMRIRGTDLEIFADNDELIEYALAWAESEINKRRNYRPKEGQPDMEKKYISNKVEGAVFYLSRIGAEGTSSVTENGISVIWKAVPDFLESVVPLLGTLG